MVATCERLRYSSPMPVYVDATERTMLTSEPDAAVLASVRFGRESRAAPAAPWLTATVPNPPLLPCPAEEIWPARGTVSRIVIEGAEAAADDRSVFVAIGSRPDAREGIEPLAFELYTRLLGGVARAGYPHVLRVWNFVPRIHDTAGGLDRYMLFCKGRSEAFAAHYGPSFSERLPAASAVGCPGDALVVHLLASREPGRYIENPRQLAAHCYPERYGPKSPSFARGTVSGPAWDGAVFVSGTASIIGHESVFPGDPRRQTEETMRNIEAVLDTARVPGTGGPMGARISSLRVYVRFPDQLDTIRAAIGDSTGTVVPTACLQAEICRPELLVEIEAIARPHRG